MKIRGFKREDKEQVEKIVALYWTDEDFRKNLSDKLDVQNKQYRFYVAEENGEIVGIAGLRKASKHMKEFATTKNPVEFYILASKYKGQGVGEVLRLKRIEEAKRLGFTEVVFYSPDSHKDSWGFHDRLGFERVGPAVAPDGEPGMIWRKNLK